MVSNSIPYLGGWSEGGCRNASVPAPTASARGCNPFQVVASNHLAKARQSKRRLARTISIFLLIFNQEAIALAADFSDANLRGARLTNADLREANLSGADLTDANLSGSDLTGSNVTQEQLDNACGSGTKLPAGLAIGPCPASKVSRPDAIAREHDPVADQEAKDASATVARSSKAEIQ